MNGNLSMCSLDVNNRGKKARLTPLLKRWVQAAVACTLVFSGATLLAIPVHAQTSGDPAPVSGAMPVAGDIRIDPSVPADARQKLTDIMEGLAPEDRDNVIYVDENNQVYANKPELVQGVFSAPVATDNSYITETGDVETIPQLTPPPTASSDIMAPSPNDAISLPGDLFSPFAVQPGTNSGSTGPFRRVYSTATNHFGYSWEGASVFLQGSSSIGMASGSQDAGFVYEGGWGAYGGAVDAGFQYSSLHNWWTATVQRESPTGPQIWHYLPSHFFPQSDVYLGFYVPKDNVVAITWKAYGLDGGTGQLTMTFAEPTSYYWSASGAGCILKRMTSIAQGPENLSDGSYIKNISWQYCEIGWSSTQKHTWAAADTGGYQSYPNNTKVIVKYTSPSQEVDSIFLGK